MRSPVGFDHGQHLGVRDSIALASQVVVPAGAGFLAKAAFLAQQISSLAVLHAGFFNGSALADGPADVIAGQVAHAERTHGKTEFLNRPVHLLGGTALIKQETALPTILFDHAVANKTIADTRHNRGFAYFFGQCHHRGEHVFGGFFTAHHLQQLHHIGRAEEMQAHHVLRPGRKAGDLVHIKG